MVTRTPEQRSLKVLMLGLEGVGKTTLITHFSNSVPRVDEPDLPHESPTVATSAGTIADPTQASASAMDKPPIDTLQFIEVNATDRLNKDWVERSKGALTACLVYDTSSPASFFTLMTWRDDVQSAIPLVPMIVIANQFGEIEVVPMAEARGWASQTGMAFISLNAVAGGEPVASCLQQVRLSVLKEERRRADRLRQMTNLASTVR